MVNQRHCLLRKCLGNHHAKQRKPPIKVALIFVFPSPVYVTKLWVNFPQKKLTNFAENCDGFWLYIRDMYDMPKTEGWNVAEALLNFFNIDNEKPWKKQR